jgi:1-acyl-sn-glycerol-3-phosphate acyltransferase
MNISSDIKRKSLDEKQSHVPRPRAKLKSLWRVGGGVLGFVGFSLLTCFGTLVLLPVALLLPGDRPRRVRRLASVGFRLLMAFIQALSLGKVHLEGGEYLSATGGCLVVANHPSFVDSIVLFARLPDANCIMKDKLRRHPLFFPFVRAGRYISNASDPLETIAACRRAKEAGETIIVFPEGSRTRANAMPRLGRGAAQIALRAGMDILPVTLRCTPPVLTHARPWYYMPERRVEYTLSFYKPRPAHEFAETEGLPPPIAARRLTSALQSWFEQQLKAPRSPRAGFSPAHLPSEGRLGSPAPAARAPQ